MTTSATPVCDAPPRDLRDQIPDSPATHDSARPFRFACPACGQAYAIRQPARQVGRRMRCRTCQAIAVIMAPALAHPSGVAPALARVGVAATPRVVEAPAASGVVSQPPAQQTPSETGQLGPSRAPSVAASPVTPTKLDCKPRPAPAAKALTTEELIAQLLADAEPLPVTRSGAGR